MFIHGFIPNTVACPFAGRRALSRQAAARSSGARGTHIPWPWRRPGSVDRREYAHRQLERRPNLLAPWLVLLDIAFAGMALRRTVRKLGRWCSRVTGAWTEATDAQR